MRIIGGKFKGRRFDPPIKKWPTRPTMDQAREALFNVLTNRIYFEEQKVLDLFGGTGSISLEFLSRGCPEVHYVDKFKGCVRFVREMAKKLDIEQELHIFNRDVSRFLLETREKYTLVFMDPPYEFSAYSNIIELIFDRQLLEESAWLIVEHDERIDLSDHPFFRECRSYGESRFTFLKEENQKSEQ
jgi:16S rRNA (guanine966-N2)-methyltransferase